MKYIIVRIVVGEDKQIVELPFIFPNMIVHKDHYESVRRDLTFNHDIAYQDVSVVGAGEINLSSMECFGYSETLKVKSRGNIDTVLIRTYHTTHGIQ